MPGALARERQAELAGMQAGGQVGVETLGKRTLRAERKRGWQCHAVEALLPNALHAAGDDQFGIEAHRPAKRDARGITLRLLFDSDRHQADAGEQLRHRFAPATVAAGDFADQHGVGIDRQAAVEPGGGEIDVAALADGVAAIGEVAERDLPARAGARRQDARASCRLGAGLGAGEKVVRAALEEVAGVFRRQDARSTHQRRRAGVELRRQGGAADGFAQPRLQQRAEPCGLAARGLGVGVGQQAVARRRRRVVHQGVDRSHPQCVFEAHRGVGRSEVGAAHRAIDVEQTRCPDHRAIVVARDCATAVDEGAGRVVVAQFA